MIRIKHIIMSSSLSLSLSFIVALCHHDNYHFIMQLFHHFIIILTFHPHFIIILSSSFHHYIITILSLSPSLSFLLQIYIAPFQGGQSTHQPSKVNPGQTRYAQDLLLRQARANNLLRCIIQSSTCESTMADKEHITEGAPSNMDNSSIANTYT